MGYRTIEGVPHLVRHYATAKRIHDEIKPIRGRSPERRPLGNRRDCDTYWVRMDGDDVQFMLYRTPVLTYKPDNTILIDLAGYNTVSTHQFIAHVLGVYCNGFKGQTVLRYKSDRYVVPKEGMTLRVEEGSYELTIVNSQRLMGYRLNRAATANVRKRYAEFYQYMKGFINLRSSMVSFSRSEYEAVSYTVGEAAEVLGTCWEHERLRVATHSWFGIADKPTESNYHYRFSDRASWELAYYKRVPRFLALIDGADRENKHQDFHKAMMILMTYNLNPIADEQHLTNVMSYGSDGIRKRLEEILFKWFAEEVVEKFELEQGKLCTTSYNKWL